jgi:hypothetical protein
MPDESNQNSGDRTTQVLNAARGAADRIGRADLVSRVDAAIERFNHPEVTLLVVGEFKQGKSSIVNAITDTNSCPVDDDVATAVATIIRHSEEPFASVTCDSADDPDQAIESSIPFEEAGSFVRAGQLAGTGQRIRSVEVGFSHSLLASGLRIVDTPGVGGLDSAHGMATMGALSMADAVLFVSDCSQEFTASELEFLQRTTERCPTVVCVMPKIDFYPQWRKIVDRNAAHLRAANLDIEIIGVSSMLHTRSVEENMAYLDAESGFPLLLERHQVDVVGQSERTHIRSALTDVTAVIAQLNETEQTELEALKDPTKREELAARADEARQRAETMKSATSRWGTTLNDGIADLTSNTDHDLRQRTRQLLAEIDTSIDANDPAEMGDELFPLVERQLMKNISENYLGLRDDATSLSQTVLDLFEADSSSGDTPDVAAPTDVFDDVGSLDVDIAAVSGKGANVLISFKGGMSGMMMVTMGGSMLGLAAFAPLGGIAMGAAVLMGRKTKKEDQERQLTMRRQQAKQGIRKYFDEVTFRVSKHSRDTLREIQRELRDANLARAQELSTTAQEAFAAANNAVRLDEGETSSRIELLTASIDQLTRISGAAAAIRAS